ncbi:IEC3 subunit of the Ino80 complex, chromatin re-modelling-domain-containing protein [Dichotomopilus funicola]|uniref:IEC3 subunit of the Ino80 complex, chromatin re-modelling-domain-containing protein n=1 Tax=Dichotomopilus funicola TaxID=1934379 RepID=A0AAN6UZE6_9PEZI|nr:IEC3 subunit of the Ino80 complex, chromatin re-modelling-domain-containing protein [Dichotomopilus funicola]
MEATGRSRLDLKVKAEDDSGDARMADDKPTYRSWKKKYRKMRITFDQKMHDGEELHRLEQKALSAAKRLAVQKDRLLDLLLDVNNCGQIPPNKRIDLSLDSSADIDSTLFLDIDRPTSPQAGAVPDKSYKSLLQEVPHFRFSSAAERFPDLLADLDAGRDSPADPAQGQNHPPSFLTADDIDNYIWELDAHLANEEAAAAAALGNSSNNKPSEPPLPTLAPLAHLDAPTNPKDSHRDLAVRNPTSVYNWLRKHAPKTFLQDGEHDTKDGSGGKDDGDASHNGHGHGAGSGRRGGKGERGSRGGGGSSSARAKRTSRVAANTESFDDMDDEAGYSGGGGGGGGGRETASTPSAAGGKGKRKRMVDDDPGYRPKGGSSRPTKKKRKSEGSGSVERTPSAAAKGVPRKSDPSRLNKHASPRERSSSAKGSGRKSEGGGSWGGRFEDD